MKKLQKLFRDAGTAAKSTTAKVGTGLTAMSASALALAGGASEPGDIVAGALSGGQAQVMTVLAVIATILAALIVWAYVKRAR